MTLIGSFLLCFSSLDLFETKSALLLVIQDESILLLNISRFSYMRLQLLIPWFVYVFSFITSSAHFLFLFSNGYVLQWLFLFLLLLSLLILAFLTVFNIIILWFVILLNITQIDHLILFEKAVASACNFIKKRLQHRCFPVKFAKFLRLPFLWNTSGSCFYILVIFFY